MKKIYTLLLLFCVFSLPLFSANGYLRYSIRYSGPDGNNPRLLIYPTQVELFLSDDAILVRTSGGVLASFFGDLVWYRAKSDSLYRVSHGNSTIFIQSNRKPAVKDFSVQKGKSRSKIAGYEGNEYKVSCTRNDSTIHWRVWSAAEPVPGTLPFSVFPEQLSLVFRQDAQALPLKLEYEEYAQQMHLTVTLTLEEESRKKQDKSIFDLPSDYKRKHTKPGERIQIGH